MTIMLQLLCQSISSTIRYLNSAPVNHRLQPRVMAGSLSLQFIFFLVPWRGTK